MFTNSNDKWHIPPGDNYNPCENCTNRKQGITICNCALPALLVTC